MDIQDQYFIYIMARMLQLKRESFLIVLFENTVKKGLERLLY